MKRLFLLGIALLFVVVFAAYRCKKTKLITDSFPQAGILASDVRKQQFIPMSGMVINEDCNHYCYDRGIRSPEPEKLLELVQHYCRGTVKEVVYNLNAMRSSVAGLPFEESWYGIEDRGQEGLFYKNKQIDPAFNNWIRGAKLCSEKGIDPYVFWIRETRKRGRRASISVRMNDLHCTNDESSFFHSEFWRRNPQFRCEKKGMLHGLFSQALDFSHDEVCNYTFSMIQAVLKRYDMDGLELDWMRFGIHSAPGSEDIARKKITNMMARIRQAARAAEKRLGHPIEISVRCQALPQEAYDVGLNVIGWAKAGLIDRVVPSPFFLSTDMEIPIAFWREILPETIHLDAGIEMLIQPDPYGPPGRIASSPATVAAQAANYFSQGAERIYFFNYMDSNTTMPTGYDEIFELGGDFGKAAKAERRHIITYHDSLSFGSMVKPLLPQNLRANAISDFLRVEIGPKPEAGRLCELLIGFEGEPGKVSAIMNNVELPFLSAEKNQKVEGKGNSFCEFASVQRIPMRAKTILHFDASKAVKDGRNTFFLRNGTEKPEKITWAELHIGAVESQQKAFPESVKEIGKEK